MADSVPILQLSHLSETERTALLTRAEADLTSFLEQVRPILDRVRNEGDHALMDFAMRFDGVEKPMISIRCDQREFTSAERSLPRDVKEAIAYAAENIRRFHESQMPSDTPMREVRPGVFAGEKTTPIPSVACYVPRGKGAFPSVALMTTLPAVVAGVSRILVMTPPGPDGTVDPATLYAAQIAGVTEVYKCGGAQGIAAVAYGTETVPKTIKVVGPGSPWVVAAKRLLADRIDTGLPAGPSESIVLADRTADPQIAALDLIVESEHGPDSSAFLVTDNREIAQSVQAAIPLFWKGLSPARASFSSTVLTGPHGGILLAETMAEAIDFINDFAPEHLEILGENPEQYLSRILNAGEILLGKHTPFTLANYLIGPNAVLPTAQWAKSFSPLSVRDFLKRSSIARVTPQAYPELAAQARILARYEGFDAHAQAVSEVRDSLLKGDTA